MTQPFWIILNLSLIWRRLAVLAVGTSFIVLLVLQISSPANSLHAQSGTAPAPTNLSASSPTQITVRLSWNAVTNAARYKVEYSKSN